MSRSKEFNNYPTVVTNLDADEYGGDGRKFIPVDRAESRLKSRECNVFRFANCDFQLGCQSGATDRQIAASVSLPNY